MTLLRTLSLILLVSCTLGYSKSRPSHSGWIFLGIEGGPTFLTSSVTNGSTSEANKFGYGIGARLGYSYYFPSLVIDVGGGWMQHEISGDRAGGSNIKIKTAAGFAELALRFRGGWGFQFGPTFGYAFGSELSFKPANQPVVAEGDKNGLFMIGIQALKDFGKNSFPMRFGIRGFTDLDISNRQIFGVQAMFQIGFKLHPITRKRKRKRKTRIKVNEAELEPVFIDIPLAKLFFATDSYKLRRRSQDAIGKIAQLLADYQNEYSAIRVEGHADKRGGYKYNIKLSQKRARAVAQVLVKAGIPRKKVTYRGYGYTRPLVKGSSPRALRKNRRVRILLYEVGEARELRDAMDRIKKDFYRGKKRRRKK